VRLQLLVPISVFCVLAPTALLAQEDSQGCKDSPLLTRVSGCYISDCSKADFDAADLTISTSGDPRTKHVEGKLEKITYQCEGKSALQVRRNAEQALRAAGYGLDFTGYDVPLHYVTSHKGPQWLAVVASEMTGSSQYNVITVLAQEMTQEMSAADAWAAEIKKSGHVAVYGIEFETGKATLRAEAEKVLGQVLTLMRNQGDWKMRVEGHSDSTGTKAGNQALSEQRAAAVVAWLVKQGVNAARLTSVGLGDAKPIADNATDDGRARNRRVELVKQ
jgi:OmpA-OmpF porin, OOP family